jgi:hypothetical protein
MAAHLAPAGAGLSDRFLVDLGERDVGIGEVR